MSEPEDIVAGADGAVPETIDPSRFELLPTGKLHVSFSEVKGWAECSYRHKLQHIDHIDADLPSVHMDFGTAMHAACEHYLRTRKMVKRIFLDKLKELWTEHAVRLPGDYTTDAFTQFGKEGLAILPEVPAWLDATFKNWEFIDAEHYLYEPIEGHPHAFKGYIDGVILCDGPFKKRLVWLLDWKTCGWGWKREKKEDDMVKAQIILYKNYWSIKTGTDPKDVRCGFVLLKRTAKAGARCELFSVSVGEVTTRRSLQVVNNMLTSIKAGVTKKNRASCTFCQFYQTPHCT